jgi:hypothetical protein
MRVSVYYCERAVTCVVGLRCKSGAHRKGSVCKAQAPMEARLVPIVAIKVLHYLGGDYGRGPRQVGHVELYFVYSLGYRRM